MILPQVWQVNVANHWAQRAAFTRGRHMIALAAAR
jgi:hypothetical protein